MALAGGLTGIGGPLVKLKKADDLAAVQGSALAAVLNSQCARTSLSRPIPRNLAFLKQRSALSANAAWFTAQSAFFLYHIAMAMILTESVKADAAHQYGPVNEVCALCRSRTQRRASGLTRSTRRLRLLFRQQGGSARVGSAIRSKICSDDSLKVKYHDAEDRLERLATSGSAKPVWSGR